MPLFRMTYKRGHGEHSMTFFAAGLWSAQEQANKLAASLKLTEVQVLPCEPNKAWGFPQDRPINIQGEF